MKFFLTLSLMAAVLSPATADEIVVPTSAPANRAVKFAYRTPQGKITAVMVIFGGRNWDAAHTLKTIDFSTLADRFGLLLVSPGFKDDDYWQPEKWSGPALEKALQQLEKKYSLKHPPLLYYGYSAGGQCANLFYFWKPERVIAWGAHGCGVWGNPELITNPVPALITCGAEDAERREFSLNFAQRSGENGWPRLWCELSGGHELQAAALDLARLFFTAVLSNEKEIHHGDDQTGEISTIKNKIDAELRSYLPGTAVKDKWLQLRERK